MKNFAVVRLAGKQHLVSEDDTLVVDGQLASANDTITLSEVLLLVRGDNCQVGTPLVGGASVQAKILSSGKGVKIDVSKFKAKSRYRRKMGFRPIKTTLKIGKIDSQ
ncbi:MAG: 50S ribosomal protein L21 [Microgenomates group bacterium GW2011_GWA1_48_10]|uniref:Large ribosomal subunit protein bL21 n=1 Tax=Candidatus Gottesmanbacteria bacterium RIFCSPHIGHO2_01_FULL_47_48 TaxID=1798381 RepID=A0A1F6A4Q1_9BACT|nr:MAG: 50S ribosomal protein L21 [Microgenomates group bacterium GW2011_GWA1_48_10]OGG19710.1 MAG: 50S ribosomal protein L21 [Candidatus Gottesmanbacteria bacterium RIFCSPHIGHO2_01_FULL_47_48]